MWRYSPIHLQPGLVSCLNRVVLWSQIYRSSKAELDKAISASQPLFPVDGVVVRIRGAPFAAAESDIRAFFDGLEIGGSSYFTAVDWFWVHCHFLLFFFVLSNSMPTHIWVSHNCSLGAAKVTMTLDSVGRPGGDCFVQFTTPGDAT